MIALILCQYLLKYLYIGGVGSLLALIWEFTALVLGGHPCLFGGNYRRFSLRQIVKRLRYVLIPPLHTVDSEHFGIRILGVVVWAQKPGCPSLSLRTFRHSIAFRFLGSQFPQKHKAEVCNWEIDSFTRLGPVIMSITAEGVDRISIVRILSLPHLEQVGQVGFRGWTGWRVRL